MENVARGIIDSSFEENELVKLYDVWKKIQKNIKNSPQAKAQKWVRMLLTEATDEIYIDSHKAAKYAAMIYSFFANCKKNQLNLLQ